MPQKLGQHFLIDKSEINKIVAAIKLSSGDVVVEIGPGRGALTFPLLNLCEKKSCEKIIAIEKDSYFVEKLVNAHAKLEVIHDDALSALEKISENQKDGYKIIGNIPYSITGKLFRVLGEIKNKPSLIILTTQKEVAERISSSPPNMNMLAASVQFWSNVKIVNIIKRDKFSPPPNVDSAVIEIIPKEKRQDKDLYYKFVKIIFKQPRKTLLNNIESGLKGMVLRKKIVQMLEHIKIAPSIRAQNLTIEDIILLKATFSDFMRE